MPLGRDRRQRRRRVAAAGAGAYAIHKHRENEREGEEQEQQGEVSETEPGSESPDATTAQSAAPAQDPVAQLTQLKSLLDSGALTQAEYDAEKQKILAA